MSFGQATSQGYLPSEPYQPLGVDSVDPTTGNLILHIPVISYSQRGNLPPLSISLIYNSGSWSIDSNSPVSCTLTNCGTAYTQWQYVGGFGVQPVIDGSLTAGQTNFEFQTTNLTFYNATDSSGAIHPIRLREDGTYESSDGTGITTPNPTYTAYPDVALTSNNGITYTGCIGNANCKINDPDGNSITEVQSGNHYISTDSVGRTIPIPPSSSWLLQPPGYTTPPPGYITPPPGCMTLSYPAYNGSAADIKYCFTIYTVKTAFDNPSVTEGTTTYTALSSITLPNGTSWDFSYDSWGALQQITMPAGGTIAYTWQTVLEGTNEARRVIYQRTLTNGSQTSTWTYNFPGFGKSIMTDPLQDTITYQCGGSTCAEPVVVYTNSNTMTRTDTQTYNDATHGLIKTINTTFLYPAQITSPPTGTPFLIAADSRTIKMETTSWPNGEQSTVCMLYDGDNNSKCSGTDNISGDTYTNPMTGVFPLVHDSLTDRFESSFGNGSPGTFARHTHYAYNWQGNSSYKEAGLFNLKASTTIYTSSSGGDVEAANTTYYYDQSPSPTGALGNLTSTTRWLSGGSSPTISTVYNIQGMPIRTQDAKGNPPTAYVYDSTGAYLSSLTRPVVNGVASRTAYSYDFNTGLLKTLTDPNGQSTTYSYDNSRRPLTTRYADSGCETYSYNDGYPASVLHAKGISSSLTWAETLVGDHFGRLVQRESNVHTSGTGACAGGPTSSSPTTSTVYEDTSYDLLGRVQSQSSPYLTKSDLSYGSTAYSLDMLGRTWTTLHYRGQNATTLVSTEKYTYAGAAVESTDGGNGSSGITKVAQSDALGRTISVCEVTSVQPGEESTKPASCGQDIVATGYLTTYTYDTLNDLIYVSQGPNITARSFVYDTLGRLLCSYNAEKGPASTQSASCPGSVSNVAFTYDPNGNLSTRTQWSPNQPLVAGITPSYSATSTYVYDALNRLQTIKYSDNSQSNPYTPSVQYLYDQPISGHSIPQQNNLVGRLVGGYINDASGTQITGKALGYDPVGRINVLAACTIDDCSSQWYYEQSYNYYFSGQWSSETLLSTTQETGFVLANTLNEAQQTTSLTSSMTGTGYPSTLISQITYSPFNGISSAMLGNGAILNTAYDERGRVACSSTQLGNTLLYSYALSNSTGACNGYPFASSASGYSGNGDIVESYDSVNGQWNYEFNSFNSLASATQLPGAGPYSPSGGSILWTYDRLGNVWNQQQTTSSGTFSRQFTYSGKNNQISKFIYDAAGNILHDGVNVYTYDAENRIITLAPLSGGTETYSYDAFGVRVRKTDGTVAGTEEEIYDKDNRQVGEMASNGSFGKVEILLGGMRLATYNAANNTSFIHSDWLGTERATSTYSGRAQQTATSLPFGDSLNVIGYETSPLHFTGKERDTESGLDYFGARYYSSAMGRFSSPDPSGLAYASLANPQSFNLYSYAWNNPLINIDPSGMECVWDDGSYDSADDPDTGNAAGCSGQGGTYVDPDLFENALLTNGQNANIQYGSWSGSANSTLAASWTTASATSSFQYDASWASAYFNAWAAGQLPTSIAYGQNDPATLAMVNRPFVQGQLAAYKAAGCPASYPAGQGSGAAYQETAGGVAAGNPNYVQAEVGGYSGNFSTSGGVTTVALSNVSGISSLSGYSAGVGAINSTTGSDFNRNAIDSHSGAGQNVTQTFTQTMPSPCGGG